MSDSFSAFLGNDPNSNKPLFHIAGTEGLSVNELTAGVRPDTIFHSSLPYVMVERQSHSLTNRGTTTVYSANGGITPSGISCKWFYLSLTEELKELLNNKVVLMFFKDSTGKYHSAPASYYSVMGIKHGPFYNTAARHSTIIGSPKLGYVFYKYLPHEHITYTGDLGQYVYPPLPAEQLMSDSPTRGYVDGCKYLAVFTDPSITMEEVVFVATNIRYSGGSVQYESMVAAEDPIFVSGDQFRVGNIDLTRYGFLKYTGANASTSPAHLSATPPPYIPPSNVSSTSFAELPASDSFSVVSGDGQEGRSIEVDLSSGVIYENREGVNHRLFSAEDSANRFLFDKVIPFSAPAMHRTWLIKETNVVRTDTLTLYSEKVSDAGTLTGILCHTGNSENVTASIIDRNSVYTVFGKYPSGKLSSLFSLSPGEHVLVNHLKYEADLWIGAGTVNSLGRYVVRIWLEYDANGVLSVKLYYYVYVESAIKPSDQPPIGLSWKEIVIDIPAFSFDLVLLK